MIEGAVEGVAAAVVVEEAVVVVVEDFRCEREYGIEFERPCDKGLGG